MNNISLDNETKELLMGSLRDGIFFLFCYAALWFCVNKFIKGKKVKAIILGLTTPFFFYYSILYLLYPLMILLYTLRIDPIGLTIGLIFALLKPLSFISGILVFFYITRK
ncbi:hypothetical protein IQ255_22680 [Pleurocapsales cyanobacterium LEGE 10410]|nr:hypothetical protein [Pleurocapsales cyanobacterium LEGE 10410]